MNQRYKRLSPEEFTYEKMSLDNEFMLNGEALPDDVEVLGWCEGVSLAVRPDPDSYGVMVRNTKTEDTYWFHLPKYLA